MAQRPPLRPLFLLILLAVGLAALPWIGGCRSILPPRVPPEPEVRWLPGVPGDVPSQTVFSPDGAGLTLVRGTLSGRDSGWLLLDSGSANLLIDRQAAKQRHLPVVGEGFAERELRVTYHLADEFTLGPLELDRVLVAAADWDRLSTLRRALGVDLAGFAGYQVFAHAVVEIQYRGAGDSVGQPIGQGDRVILHDPATYRLPRGSWQPLRTIDRRPTVVAHVTVRTDEETTEQATPPNAPARPGQTEPSDPEAIAEAAPPSSLRALFVIDTGTAGGLILDARFAREAGLPLDPSGAASEQITLTGTVPVATSRVPQLSLGERTFDDVPTTIRTDLFRGRAALAAVDGMIGRRLLEGHTVVFDLPHQRIALLDPER